MNQRPYVLGGVLAVTALLAAVILIDVLATVFLALTVAYLLSPVRRQLRRRGFSRITATVVVTVAAVFAVLLVFSPLAYLLFIRFSDLVDIVTRLPDSLLIEFAGFSYTVVVGEVIAGSVEGLQAAAVGTLSALPVVLLQVALFVLLVFSTLYNEQNIRAAVISVVPPEYRDIAEALHNRAKDTLYALYVVQAATGFATFVLALPVFFIFGYSSPFVLAIVAGILQFVPILGPSVLIVALVASELLAGDIAGAVAIGVVGGIVIVAVPDVILRPRLASRQAKLDSSLYFIGFVGGLLSLGAIGIIVGPLVVALLVEAAGLLTAEYADPNATADVDPADDPPDTPPATTDPPAPADPAATTESGAETNQTESRETPAASNTVDDET